MLDEDYTWKTFKGSIIDKEVSAWYDMSVRDFECSVIHDLFKVGSFLLSPFYFLRNFGKFLTLLHPSIFQAMAKFYTASSQAKELCDEAKAAKAKSKELKAKFLLKKGEVIRLTEELTRLQGIEKKLRNKVEELKADSIERETCINHLEVKVQGFALSLENAQKEAIATFMKLDYFTNHLD